MVEPSALTVPVKEKVWLPATAVSVTFEPLAVPVTTAEPLLQNVPGWDGTVIV
jgi:hypothetical protein